MTAATLHYCSTAAFLRALEQTAHEPAPWSATATVLTMLRDTAPGTLTTREIGRRIAGPSKHARETVRQLIVYLRKRGHPIHRRPAGWCWEPGA